MPTMVALPTIGKEAVNVFGALFANEPARRHCAAYLPGLIMAAKKTVSGSHRALVVTAYQCGLHRWWPEVAWDVKALHDRRLEWGQHDPKTRYRPRGVMAIDNTLGAPPGKLSAEGGWFWDHAHERDVLAHDDLRSHDGWAAGAHEPMDWRRFQKKDACEQGACKDHTAWCLELSNDASARGLPGACTLDSSCTRAKVLKHLESPQRASVGDRKLNRQRV